MIIIVLLAVIACILAVALFGALANSVTYERIEIIPNGTSIEIPTDEAKYDGEMNETGAKQWTFKQGSLVTYNSEEAIDARGIYGLGGAMGFKTINDMILNHFEKREEIDGFTVYTIDGAKLGIEGRGLMYCIITGNNDTHDNIIITADNKDIALHMAKSIHYENANISNTTSNGDNTVSTNNPSNTHNDNNNNKNKYSAEDLERASREGYETGYSDASRNSNDYDNYQPIETTTDS